MPFGPSARLASPATMRNADAGLIPPAASDFWGEDSAALQDALQAPSGAALHHARDESFGSTVPHAPHAPPETTVRDASQAPGGRTARRRWSIYRSSSSARARGLRSTPRLRRPGRTRAAVGVIAGLALIVSVTQSGSSANPKKGRVRTVVTLPASIGAPSSKPSLTASTKRIANGNPGRRSQRNPRDEIHRTVKRARHTEPQRSAPTQPAVVASSSPVPSNPAPAQNVPSSETSSPPSASSATHDTQSVVRNSAPPGPTGTVSLIGSGTSPSG